MSNANFLKPKVVYSVQHICCSVPHEIITAVVCENLDELELEEFWDLKALADSEDTADYVL